MKKAKSNPLSQGMIDLIRITPEMTEQVKSKLNYTITPRPDENPPRGKLIWCPYHSKWTKFIQKDFRTITECCGISNEDFWIKCHNGLFKIQKGSD